MAISRYAAILLSDQVKAILQKHDDTKYNDNKKNFSEFFLTFWVHIYLKCFLHMEHI